MVGSAVVRALQSRGYENIITRTHSELDLTRQENVERFFRKESPEYVFLAAAKVGGILANDTYKADFIYNNIMIAANVIHSAYASRVKKLLNLGSSCIYPKYAQQPLREDSLLTGTLEPTNEPYAIAKIAALKLCRYYNEQYQTNFISAMPTNLYGPHDNYNLETSHVLPALIRKFHFARLLRNGDMKSIKQDIRSNTIGFGLDEAACVDDEKSIVEILQKVGVTRDYVVLWGSGEVYREFLHVDDLADACVFLMEKVDHDEAGELVNIGTGKDIWIKDVALMVKEATGFEGEVRHDLTKPDGTPRKLLDVSKIKSMGWKAKVSLQDGIQMAYEWYCNSICLPTERTC